MNETAALTGSVDLLVNDEGGVYIERRDGEGNSVGAWYLGMVTPEMHGTFAGDAHAWLAGHWQPGPDAGAVSMEWDAWRAGKRRAATYDPPTPGATCVLDREAAPAALDYIEGPLCTSCGYATVARIEVNGEPKCGNCAEELRAEGDAGALDQIAGLIAAWDARAVTDGDYGAPTLTEIAAIVRSTGRNADAAEAEARRS